MAYIEIYKRYLVIPRLYEFLQKVYSLIFRGCGSIIESNQERQEIRVDFKKKAFLALKEIFTKKLILAMFNFVEKIIVEIDTNKIVLDSILNQFDEKKRLYSIIFYSRKFIVPELNYDIYDKKLLTIVNSFKI